MSKKKLSNNKIAIVCIALIIALILLIKFFNYIQLYGEMHYDKDPYIDTIFAENFSPDKFGKVDKAMTKDQIIELLGEPITHDAFGIRNLDDINQIVMPYDPRYQDCWRYSTDGKLGEKGDTSWYSFIVCFKDDKVSEKQVNEFFD